MAKKTKKNICVTLREGHTLVKKVVDGVSIKTDTMTGKLRTGSNGKYHLHPKGRKGYYIIEPTNIVDMKVV